MASRSAATGSIPLQGTPPAPGPPERRRDPASDAQQAKLIGESHPPDADRRASYAAREPKSTIRDASGLIAAGLASSDNRAMLEAVEARYAIAVPQAVQSLIAHVGDPIARQFVPDLAELITATHELQDPIGDDAKSPIKGIVHRYADRALLKPLLVCPVYCRFCFRREHVGPDGGLLTEAELQAAFAWLAAHPDIREVILTGGDPLMLSPRRLAAIIGALSGIASIETIRVHSRVPFADPERLSDALAASLETDRAMWLVVHANHATEFTPAAKAALRRVQAQAIPVLGQSVLLRGVNDTEDALEALLRAMVQARVKPYYLHQLDPAPGTARFHVPIEQGRSLLSRLRGRVTGLAWPTYVLDIPGGHGKVPIGPEYLVTTRDTAATTAVRDPAGQLHALRTAGMSGTPSPGGALAPPVSSV